MAEAEILVEIVDQVGWVIVNRPAASNSVLPSTMQAMCEALDRLIADPEVKAIALTGQGRNFLAGGDLDWLETLAKADAPEIGEELYTYFRGAARRIYQCPKPTLAAVAGAAVTVGCELALCCDVRIAADTALFQQSWINLGLIAPLGGSVLLPNLIGLARAKEMILEARAVRAQQALAWGLVSEVVAVDALRATAQARAVSLAARPPAVYQAAKEALHRGMESTMEQEWTTNIRTQAVLLRSEPFRACLAGILAVRAAKAKA